jgi:hypothetical protein
MQAKRIAGTALGQLTAVHSYEEFAFVTKLHKAG